MKKVLLIAILILIVTISCKYKITPVLKDYVTYIEFIEKAEIGEIEFLSFSNIIVKGPEGKEIKAGGLSIKFQK
ncbi:MAG: hypothetical protein PHP52_00525 [Bacteroidales bacterium]|jgi:hypothetical protein|nr:hypothetical protein [Bacteroidales bacterium]MDD4216300.1 hypothetical protein [Bacteroidales bacterium]MDY0141737.1 hypothetical protein [Bacteroidales bacterium]